METDVLELTDDIYHIRSEIMWFRDERFMDPKLKKVEMRGEKNSLNPNTDPSLHGDHINLHYL